MNPTACKSCGLPIFHGPAGYAGPQCMCRWTNAAPRQPEGEGLEVVAFYWLDTGYENPNSHGPYFGWPNEDALRRVDGGAMHIALCHLSDAQRAIAELRDRLDVMTQCADNYSRMFEESAEECEHLKACQENDMLHMTGLVAECERLRVFNKSLDEEASKRLQDVTEAENEAYTLRQQLAERDAEIMEQCRLNGMGAERELKLLTQRDKLAGLLREKFPRIDPEKPYPLDEVEHHCEYTLYQERERLHREIDAALAEVNK